MPTPLERFFEAAGCRTQTELAEFLGIRQSSIADAKKRASIPPDWLLKLLNQKGINPSWVITGQGARFMRPTDNNSLTVPAVVQQIVVRPPEECSIEELSVEIIRRAIIGIRKVGT